MTVVFALLVLGVVVAGAVLVVKSPTPHVAPTEMPSPTAGLPTPVTSADLRQVRFPVVFRGYRMDEVDALLARLAAQLEPSDPPMAQTPTTLPTPTGMPVIPGTELPR